MRSGVYLRTLQTSRKHAPAPASGKKPRRPSPPAQMIFVLNLIENEYLAQMIRTEELSHKLTKSSKKEQFYFRLCVKYLPLLRDKKKYNITISEEHKFVWFRIAKVGTRTMLDMFSNKSNLSSYHAMWCYFPAEQYKDYFKFAFTRNPIDRFTSAWFDKVCNKNYFRIGQDKLEKLKDFNYFIDLFKEDSRIANDQHFKRQSDLIDINNIDFIGRIENFENDLNVVYQKINVSMPTIIHKNRSQNNDMIQNPLGLVTQKRRDKIIEHYSKDFSIFGYTINC